MDLVLSALRLDAPGGMQSYLLTIAPQLVRLGHAVTLYAPALGPMAEVARGRGLTVVGCEEQLPVDCDAVIAQDAVTSLQLTAHYPRAARLLVVHSAEYDVHLPPGDGELVDCAIALNDAVARRVRSSGWQGPVVRLRQPIDRERLRATGVVRERPERVLLLGNYLGGRERDAFEQVCRDAGLGCGQVGLHGRLQCDPVDAIEAADIVVGQGRSALDAMSCGRAVFVYGPAAADGWVTAESYPALEADGFRGRASSAVLDPGSFATALGDYCGGMGQTNRKLVALHHSAHEHASALVEQASRLPRPSAPVGGIADLARTIRIAVEAQGAVEALTHQLRAALSEQEEARGMLQAAVAERDRARHALQLVEGSWRWRTTSRLLRPLDGHRRRVRP